MVAGKTPKLATVTGCTFNTNKALEGGAIQIGPSSALAVVGSIFYGNKAIANGGAMKIESFGAVFARNSQFTSNIAGDFGGALSFGSRAKSTAFDMVTARVELNALGLSRLTFVHNTASTGGAIFWQDSEFPSQGGQCETCTFTANAAVFGGPDRGTDIKTICPKSTNEVESNGTFSVCDSTVEIKFEGTIILYVPN